MKYNVNKKCIKLMKDIQDKHTKENGFCSYNSCRKCILCAIGDCLGTCNIKEIDIESELEKIDISISKGKDFTYIIFYHRDNCLSTSRRIEQKDLSFMFSKFFNCKI